MDRVIAVHESGHAVSAALLMPGALSHVSLARSGLSDGHTQLLLADESMMTRAAIENAVTVLLSGYAAEELCCPAVSAGSITDLSLSSRLLFLIHGTAGLGETLVPLGKAEDAEHAMLLDPHLREVIDKELQRLLDRADRAAGKSERSSGHQQGTPN
jgi:ATP-dependent Zn protease